MPILGLDTSTLIASVAVCERDGDSVRVLAAHDNDVDTHSERLVASIDEVLVAAGVRSVDLDGIAVGAGPGSFTGLRIGMATAKGLAFAIGRPLWAVSSLAALATDCGLHCDPDRPIAAVLDARRQEIFVGCFRWRHGRPEALGDERVLPPAELPALLSDVLGHHDVVAVGDGLDRYADTLAGIGNRRRGARTTPSGTAAAHLALLGSYPDALAHGTPVYIRPSEAEVRFPDGNPGGTFRPPDRNDT